MPLFSTHSQESILFLGALPLPSYFSLSFPPPPPPRPFPSISLLFLSLTRFLSWSQFTVQPQE